ncbi:hypothetical protein ANCCAN_23246 [Ancylostoma caninum]|uniref:Uncharacterized protein n=1 Tax=Ancylostoma caninum TaxID=29170 RepID=A0A368FFZ9_ANCCA|nr:hypothetical protein ANCCAN_23246 [Ancylostoma caninum]
MVLLSETITLIFGFHLLVTAVPFSLRAAFLGSF